jgi:uncharacterized protein YjbI with pentapeptide repeats
MSGTCEHSFCDREALEDDAHCILHAEDSGKNQERFEEALQEHWKNNGPDYRRIVFPIDPDFSNTTFGMKRKVNFSGSVFLEATDFSGATFLGEADFSGAVFEGPVSFRGATFEDVARFSDVTFEEADFSEAVLTEADFSGTDLSWVTMAGADLTGATLPEDVAQFTDELTRVEKATQYARRLFFMLLLACAYSWLAIGTTSDAELFVDASTGPLPFVGTSISIVGFYWTAPFALLVLYVYFHLQLQRLWEEVARLPSVFPDGKPLDKKTDPWLLLGLTRAHCAHLGQDELPFFRIQKYVAHLVVWWTVPITLICFGFRYLPKPDPLGTGMHFILVVGAAGFAASFYQKAASTLGKEKKATEDLRIVPPLIVAGVAALLLFGSHWTGITRPYLKGVDLQGVDLSLAFFNADLRGSRLGGADLRRSNLPKARLQGANLNGAELDRANLVGAELDSTNLARADLDSTDLSGADLSKSSSLAEAENLASAKLSGALLRGLVLRGVPLPGAKLQNAVLDSASLAGANLSDAFLNEADLSNANLYGAELDTAKLREANLQGAFITTADLSKANLYDAELESAILRGTELPGADLRKAELSSTILRKSNLSKSNLYNAELDSAILVKANIEGAFLKETSFSYANLMRANLVGTKLDSANLSKAKLSGADLSKTSLLGSDVMVDSLCQAATLERAELNGSTVASVCDLCPKKFGAAETYSAEDPRRCGR